jgi:hypothetical protein
VPDLPREPDPSTNADARPALSSPPGVPGWVKVFGIAILILVLGLIDLISADHDPSRPLAHRGPGGAAPAAVTAQRVYRP